MEEKVFGKIYTPASARLCHKISEYSRVAVWEFVVSLVVLHVERHAANLALEAKLVPYLRRPNRHSEYIQFLFRLV